MTLFGLLHFSFGRRMWEAQASGPYCGNQASGAPYLTLRDAMAAARIWKTYEFYDRVVVRNLRNGEIRHP